MTDEPRSILITGASSGLGEALARHYAAPGRTLFLSGRDETRLAAVAAACREAGAEVREKIIDVTDEEGMKVWIAEADAAVPLGLVIANAGISGGTAGRLDGEPAGQAHKIFAVNVTGVFNTVEPALASMLGRGRGQIALISSLAGFRGWAAAPAYCASKAAVRLYGEGLRGALLGTGVRINVICPGFVETRMTARNAFPMPFKWTAPKAARKIAAALKRDKSRYAFPWPLYALVRLAAACPDSWMQHMQRKLPAKAAYE